MVTVENVHTKVQSTFTDAEWHNIQNKKEWKDTFKVVGVGKQKKTEVPKEVANLAQDKTTPKQEAAGAVKETEAPAVPKEVQEAEKTKAEAAKKPTQDKPKGQTNNK